MGNHTDTKARLASALALLSGVNDAAAMTPGDVKAFPVTKIRQGLAPFMMYSTVDELMAARVDFRSALGNLFSWQDPKATKIVTKAAAATLQAVDTDGVSRYGQAVEMLSFAGAAAPLLEPDRLARLISHASETATAYAPITWPAQLAAGLQQVLGSYPEQRRETLLIDLWDLAHDGRWWEKMHLTKAPVSTPRRRRRHPDVEDANSVSAQLVAGHVTVGIWDPESPEIVGNLKFSTTELGDIVERLTNRHCDPDYAIAGSAIRQLCPQQRPESPITAIVDSTIATIAYLRDNEAGDLIPAKPSRWAQLCPSGDMRPYPVPEALLDVFQSKPFPGYEPDGNGDARSWVRICRSTHELRENSQFMGNCTGGWVNRSEQGTAFIIRAHINGVNDFNAEVRVGANGFTLGEVNSRHNRREVPRDISDGFTALLAAANARR